MFGVLWSNLNESYGAMNAPSSLQPVFEFAQDSLIQFRFYSLLGFLFGIGFAVQLARAGQRGSDIRNLFWRRMAVLLAIGMVHGLLIWHNDVLTEYALLGMVLVFFRRLSSRLLLWTAAILTVAVPYLMHLASPALGRTFPPLHTPPEVDWIYAHGSFSGIVAEGARSYVNWYCRWFPLIWPSFLALFVLGLWAVRVDLFKRLMAKRTRLLGVLAGATAVTLAGRALPPVGPWVRDLVIWSNAAAYAAALALVVSTPAGARRLTPLAAVGRMSLTTYLAQSIVSVLLFYHYGLGWYGRVSLAGMFAITILVFALQMAASVWWLRRYRFGPVEWLWRSAAYGKCQPMRREPA